MAKGKHKRKPFGMNSSLADATQVMRQLPVSAKEKVGGFGDKITVCPNCEHAAISNPYRKGKEIYPYCPWCGQKLKEGEYDRHN